jgi:hypothetical protein
MSNLRDSNIFQDFTVWINDVGKIGEARVPAARDQHPVEEFRGGGMDGTVEIPMGIEKIEFDFELHTWDAQVWTEPRLRPWLARRADLVPRLPADASGAEGRDHRDPVADQVDQARQGRARQEGEMTVNLVPTTTARPSNGDVVRNRRVQQDHASSAASTRPPTPDGSSASPTKP